MKTLKRLLSFVLAAALTLSCTVTCFAADDSGTRTYTGASGMTESDQFRFEVKLNYDWFVYGDNTVYYSDLAQFCAVAAGSTYATEAEAAEGDIPGYYSGFFRGDRLRGRRVDQGRVGDRNRSL